MHRHNCDPSGAYGRSSSPPPPTPSSDASLSGVRRHQRGNLPAINCSKGFDGGISPVPSTSQGTAMIFVGRLACTTGCRGEQATKELEREALVE